MVTLSCSQHPHRASLVCITEHCSCCVTTSSRLSTRTSQFRECAYAHDVQHACLPQPDVTLKAVPGDILSEFTLRTSAASVEEVSHISCLGSFSAAGSLYQGC